MESNELKATLGEAQAAKLKAHHVGNGKGKKGKANLAEVAIEEADEESGYATVEQVNQAFSSFEDKVASVMARELRPLREQTGNMDARLKAIEERAAVVSPSIASVIAETTQCSREDQAKMGNAIDHVQTAKLPWGYRQVARGRRSTVGQVLELTAIGVGLGTGLYLGGKAGYSKLRG